MTPIERAARALHAAKNEARGLSIDWESLADGPKSVLLGQARAVLTAIREPSEAMVKAAQAVDFIEPGENDSGEEWQAMIDAALEQV